MNVKLFWILLTHMQVMRHLFRSIFCWFLQELLNIISKEFQSHLVSENKLHASLKRISTHFFVFLVLLWPFSSFLIIDLNYKIAHAHNHPLIFYNYLFWIQSLLFWEQNSDHKSLSVYGNYYQNWTDLLWNKNILVIEKEFWKSRLDH